MSTLADEEHNIIGYRYTRLKIFFPSVAEWFKVWQVIAIYIYTQRDDEDTFYNIIGHLNV